MPALAPAIPPFFGTALAEAMQYPQGPISGPAFQIIGYIMSDGNGNQTVVPVMPGSQAIGRGLQIQEPILNPEKKRKRKTSKYQREFGKQLKALKRKHPRTPVTRLMKRAHRATKRKMK